MIDYHDFWMRIERRGDGFWVTVRSPAGECDGPLRLPEGADAYSLAALVNGARGGLVRGAPGETPGTEAATRDLDFEGGEAGNDPDRAGRELFQALFNESIRDALSRSQGMMGKEGGLRFRLQIDLDDPQLARLASLPWELLYDERTRTAFGRSPYTPIVRYVEVLRPYDPPPFTPPLRVLIALANPAGTHPLDLEKERAAIEKTWAKLDGVEVEIIEHATREKLFDALDRGVFHVLHYMGHGGFDERTGRGALFLETPTGEAEPILGETLGDTLRDERSMRLVVLNACDTGKASHSSDLDPFAGVAAALVMAGIPAVVAMQVPVADHAAVAFAEKFYADLATGRPVDASVAAGRKAIYRANPESLEWATPVLFMRAPDGRLFSTPPTPDPPPTPASTPAPAPIHTPPPTAAAEPPRKRGLLWAGLGGLALLILVIALSNGLAGGSDEEIDAPSAESVDPEVAALMDEYGYSEPEADYYPHVLTVAEALVAQQATLGEEGYEPLWTRLYVLREGMNQEETVPLEPGYEYAFFASCDRDCLQITLSVFDSEGNNVAENRSDYPFVTLTAPPEGDTYTAGLYLEDCNANQCYLGLGVYGRPVVEEELQE